MIREYTNRAVADILEEEEGSQVRIEPVLFLGRPGYTGGI